MPDLFLVLFFLTLNMKMLISLNFNLFGNVLHKNQKNQRWISDPHIIYDGALCDNIISGGHYLLTSNSNLDDVGVIDLPLFSFHDKRGQKRRGLKHFTYCYLLSFLGASNIIHCCCSLIDPFVYWRFCKVLFESISFFWKYSNELKVQKFFISKQNLFSH